MKISDLEFYLVEIPARGDKGLLGDARDTASAAERPAAGVRSRRKTPVPACPEIPAPVRSLLVRLSTASGLEGWGECGLPWRQGELLARRDFLLPLLAGRSVFDIEELHTLQMLASPPLRCALEMACWDLAGRAAGQPLCHLFGGGYRRRVPIAVRLSGRRPDHVAQLARELAAQGFCCQIAASLGRPDLDCAMLRLIRDSVGDRVELRFDALARYDADVARNLCDDIQRQRLQFLIDPVGRIDNPFCPLAKGQLDAVAALARQTGVPLALWRGIATAADVLAAVRAGAASFVVADLERVGGLSPARACAAVAAAAGIPALMGGRPALGIGTAAMLHLAAATPAFSAGNECAYHALPDDVLCEPLEIVGGMMTVPQGPGLGVEVDRTKLERYLSG